MIVDIEGIACQVPDRWAGYTDEQREAVRRLVHGLKIMVGRRLLKVSVTRLVRGMAAHDQPSWRVVYGYSVGGP